VVALGGEVGLAGGGRAVIAPAGVTRPILLPLSSVNQRLPSGPTVMARGPLRGAGLGSGGNSVTTPAGVICAILLPKNSVNQRLPSRPAVMAKGPLSLMRSEANSVI